MAVFEVGLGENTLALRCGDYVSNHHTDTHLQFSQWSIYMEKCPVADSQVCLILYDQESLQETTTARPVPNIPALDRQWFVCHCGEHIKK